MKVQNNSIFMDSNSHSSRYGETEKSNIGQRKSIDGSSLQSKANPIEAKREAAKKKAMQIIGSAISNELKMDDEVALRRDKIKSLHQEMNDAKQSIKNTEDERAALREAYGVDENSQEEQDLKLLEKEIRYKMPGNDVHFDKGDLGRIAELKRNGLTEYQQRSLEMLESEVPYAKTVYENKQEIMVENQIISATNLERLKSHSVEDAQKQADAIIQATAKETISMLADEAKEHIEEKSKEEKEKAKIKEEKAEELQARIDAAKERRNENKKFTEDILDGVAEATSVTTNVNAAQQEINDMMHKMNLIEDDIKGAAVDKTI